MKITMTDDPSSMDEFTELQNTLMPDNSNCVAVKGRHRGELKEKKEEKPVTWSDYSQYSVYGNGTYSPTTQTVPILPNSVYRIKITPDGTVFFTKVKIVTDDLALLPDSANERVLTIMNKFWNSKAKYIKHGLLYKRGVLLWGLREVVKL